MIFFDSNSSQIKTLEKQKLDSIHNLQKTPKSITITGYCDQNAAVQYNLILSENRAKTVAQYLKQFQEFENLPIQVLGKGEIQGENLSYNRRVEITFDYTEDYFSNLKMGQKVSFKNLIFEGNRHVLKEESIPVLEEILHSLNNNPKINVRIEGHICCTPSNSIQDGFDEDTGLYNLSEARAKAIYDYLIENGISKNRLSYEGKANQFPLGGTEDDDRRVEFIIIEN